MKESTGSENCGRAELSNSCEVFAHFCYDANEDCYYTPNYGEEE